MVYGSTRKLLGAVCLAALGMALPAEGYEVAVYNPDMEAASSRLTLEGQNIFVQFGMVNGVPTNPEADGWNKFQEYNRNGSPVYIWDPGDPTLMGQLQQDFEDGLSSDDGVYRRADDGMGGVDADGNPAGTAILVRTYWNDNHPDMATSGSPAEFGGVRNFEAATQILTEVFDPTSRYILTAATGDRVSSQVYDWAAHSVGNRGVTIDGDPEPYNGYDLQIVAGGTHDNAAPSNARYEHYNYGGTLIASNPGAVSAPNVWEIGMTEYTPNPSTQEAMNALAGELIQIRLAALEGPDHSITSSAIFDNVSLRRIVAGDANEDDLVDFLDFSALSGSFGAGGGGWAGGDFNGDGITDFLDFSALSGNFGFSAVEPEADSASVPEPGSLAVLGLGGLALFARRRRG